MRTRRRPWLRRHAEHAQVDDPRAVARFGLTPQQLALVENAEWLLASGEGLEGAVRRLGYSSRDSLLTVLTRARRPDLYAALRSRDRSIKMHADEASSPLATMSDQIGTVEQIDPETRRKASLTVVELAHDRDDAALLLDMLGLVS